MTHGAIVYPAPANGLRDKLLGAFLILADGAGAAGSRDVLDEAVVQGGRVSTADTRHGAVIHPAPGGGGPDASLAMAGDGRRHGGVCSPCLYDMLCTVKNARLVYTQTRNSRLGHALGYTHESDFQVRMRMVTSLVMAGLVQPV